VLYCWFTLLIKLSLGLYFLRVLPHRWQRVVAYSLIIVSTIVNFNNSWWAMFSCGTPTNYADRFLEGKCEFHGIRIPFVLYFQGATNMLVDIVLLALPISTILKSMLNTRAKLSVLFMFFLACSYVKSVTHRSPPISC
jgi:hypothetical protein